MTVINMDDFECVFVWSGEVGEALWTGPHVTGAVVQGHQSTGGQGQLLFVVVAVVLLGEEMSWVPTVHEIFIPFINKTM